MKIYIAAKFEDTDSYAVMKKRLEAEGHSITYDWTVHNENELSKKECALADTQGVIDCDLLLLKAHVKGKGQYSELGMAIALKKPSIIIDDGESTNIFFHHPLCRLVAGLAEAMEIIKNGI